MIHLGWNSQISGASENHAHLQAIAAGNTTYVTQAQSVVSIVGMDIHASVILTAVGDFPLVVEMHVRTELDDEKSNQSPVHCICKEIHWINILFLLDINYLLDLSIEQP